MKNTNNIFISFYFFFNLHVCNPYYTSTFLTMYLTIHLQFLQCALLIACSILCFFIFVKSPLLLCRIVMLINFYKICILRINITLMFESISSTHPASPLNYKKACSNSMDSVLCGYQSKLCVDDKTILNVPQPNHHPPTSFKSWGSHPTPLKKR